MLYIVVKHPLSARYCRIQFVASQQFVIKPLRELPFWGDLEETKGMAWESCRFLQKDVDLWATLKIALLPQNPLKKESKESRPIFVSFCKGFECLGPRGEFQNHQASKGKTDNQGLDSLCEVFRTYRVLDRFVLLYIYIYIYVCVWCFPVEPLSCDRAGNSPKSD